MNQLILTGNLGQDAELKTLDSGDTVMSFSLAVSKKNKDGENTTTWVSCSKWFKKDQSTKVAEFLKRGQTILVSGEASTRAWVKENKAFSSLECKVNVIELLGKREQTQPAEAPRLEDGNEQEIDSLPF